MSKYIFRLSENGSETLFTERIPLATVHNYGPGDLEVGNTAEYDDKTTAVFLVSAGTSMTFFWFHGMNVKAVRGECWGRMDRSANGDKLNFQEQFHRAPPHGGDPAHIVGHLKSTGSHGLHSVTVTDDLIVYDASKIPLGLLYPITMGLHPGTTSPDVYVWNDGPGTLQVLTKKSTTYPLDHEKPWDTGKNIDASGNTINVIEPNNGRLFSAYNNVFLFTNTASSPPCNCFFSFHSMKTVVPG